MNKSLSTIPQGSRVQANGTRNGTTLNAKAQGCDIVRSARYDLQQSKRRFSCCERKGTLTIPYNISSYALLLMMVAQVTGLRPGEFVHTIGDAHIYLNHIEQVREQLSRTPFELPRVYLNPKIKNIDDFKLEDITLQDYQCHPAIKGEVSV